MKNKLMPGFALVLVFLSIAVVQAQPIATYRTSLEAMVAKSQSVYRGSISNYTQQVVSAPWTKFTNGVTTGPPDGLFKNTLTVQVQEVLKGQRCKTVALTTETYGWDKTVEQWTRQHTELLLFANGSATASLRATNIPALWRVIRLGKQVPAENSISTATIVKLPVPLADATELSRPKDILAHARATAKQRDISTNTFWLGSGMNRLEVPVTPALEKRAHKLVKSKNWADRVEGTLALENFNSAENIKLLKPLLADTNYLESGVQNCPWIEKRIYYTRQAAYNVLQKWGVNVFKPVLETHLPWHYDPDARHELKVQIPNTLSVTPLGPNGDNISIGSDMQTESWTNVMVGSNMITGARSEWFVYPEPLPRPGRPTTLTQDYWPASPHEYFRQDRGFGIPAGGRKYVVELNYTLFETDNPPVNPKNPDDTRTDIWRPQDGGNYRVLVQRTLQRTFGGD